MFDLGAMQTLTLWLILIGSGFAFLSVAAGVYSAMTGKDHWPQPFRRFRRRTPATDGDRRLHGFGMALQGCAVLLILSGITLNTLAIGDRVGEPQSTIRFVITVIMFVASLAGMIGAYVSTSRVNYLYRGLSSHEGVES